MLFSLAALALGLATADAAEALDPGDGAAVAADASGKKHDDRRERGGARPAPTGGSRPTGHASAPSGPRPTAASRPASAPVARPPAPRAAAPSAPSASRAPATYASPYRPPVAAPPRAAPPSAPPRAAAPTYRAPAAAPARAPMAPQAARSPYAAPTRPPVPGTRAYVPAVTPARVAASPARSVGAYRPAPSRPEPVRSGAVRPAHPPAPYRPVAQGNGYGRGHGHVRPAQGYGHYHPGWYRPHFYQPVVVERYYSAYSYPIRPWTGVFAYGPAPVYHTTYVVQQQAAPERRVEVEKEHLPDRRIDRKDTFAVGVRGGSFLGGYDHAAPYADPGLGLTVRYRPEEAIGLELGITRFDPTWKDGSTRTQTFGQASLELFAFPWARVSPYALGGVTYGTRRFSDDIADDQTGAAGTIIQRDGNWGPHVGLGVEFALGKTVALDFDARYQALVTAGPQDPTLPIGLQANAGVMIHF